MRRRVLAACVALTACGLFPDLGGLTEEASQDAAIFDVSSSDVLVDVVDTGAVESGTADATPEASDAGDGAVDSGFCATHPGHTFCEDFDEPNFASRWSGVVTTSGATVVQSTASFVSAPDQLLATATFPANSTAANAFTFKHFAKATSLKIQAELQVDANGLPQIDPLIIVFSPPPTGYSTYEIHIDTGDGHLGYSTTPDGGTNTNIDTTFAAPLTSWHLVEVDFDTSTAVVQVFLDGVSMVNWKIAPLTPAAFDLRFGVVRGLGAATATAGSVHVDNVLVDTK